MESTGYKDSNNIPICVGNNCLYICQFTDIDPDTFGGVPNEMTYKGYIEKQHGKYGLRITEIVERDSVCLPFQIGERVRFGLINDVSEDLEVIE